MATSLTTNIWNKWNTNLQVHNTYVYNNRWFIDHEIIKLMNEITTGSSKLLVKLHGMKYIKLDIQKID